MNLAIVEAYPAARFLKNTYNRQDIGLAKALKRAGHNAYVVLSSDENGVIQHSSPDGKVIEEYRAKSLVVRSHALFNVDFLKPLKLDGMICLGDIQLIVPRLFRWCQKNGVTYWPYLGTMETHRLGSPITRWLVSRNMNVYRQCHCLAKTPAMLEELRSMGVSSTSLLPVGLDSDNLTRITPESRREARAQLGYREDEKVVVYVGRLEAYKRPLETLEAFAQMRKRKECKLLAVGNGVLLPQFEAKISQLGLQDSVQHLKSNPQTEMWQIYCAGDVLINLNEGEIFGMVLSESLYYGLPIVAVRGPGPDYLVRNGVDGNLVEHGDVDSLVQATIAWLEKGERVATAEDGDEHRFSWTNSLKESAFPWPNLP
jgi:1,2-diacylglycerol 3-alpha-glucosyltransferase